MSKKREKLQIIQVSSQYLYRKMGRCNGLDKLRLDEFEPDEFEPDEFEPDEFEPDELELSKLFRKYSVFGGKNRAL